MKRITVAAAAFLTLGLLIAALGTPQMGSAQAEDADAPPTAVLSPEGGGGEAAPSYLEVHTFFRAYCMGCHNERELEGGLSLENYDLLLLGGNLGEVVAGGDPEGSRLLAVLEGRDELQMPPPAARQPSPEEIALVRRWIEAGAAGPQPGEELPTEPLVPEIAANVEVSPAVTAVAFWPGTTGETPVPRAAGQASSVTEDTGETPVPPRAVVAAAVYRDVVLLDAETGEEIARFGPHASAVTALAFSPDGSVVAAAGGAPSQFGEVRLWAVEAGSGQRVEGSDEEGVAGGEQSDIPEAADSAEASAASDSPAGARSALPRTAEPIAVLGGHHDTVYAVAFSPDGTRIATASYDRRIMLWDGATYEQAALLEDHTDAVFDLAFSPDGRWLASASADRTVKLWDAATGERRWTMSDSLRGVTAVAFHPQGSHVAAAGEDRMIRTWRITPSGPVLEQSAFAHDAAIIELAYSPDGATLYSAAEDRSIKAWDAQALVERHVFETQPDWALALALSPDGARLAVGRYDGSLALYNAADATLVAQLLSAPEADQPGEQPQQAEAPPAEEQPNPPAPALGSVSPNRVTRGQTVQLTLNGTNIRDADAVFITGGIEATILAEQDAENVNVLRVEATIPGDAGPGTRQVFAHTALGMTAGQPLVILPFAEIGETEPNNTTAEAQPASFPAVLFGTINQTGDADHWAFTVEAGQEVVFETSGSGLGSELDAVLTLTTQDGHVLARAERLPHRGEPILGHRFEQAGTYVLRVTDRQMRGGGNMFYFLTSGAFPYVTSVHPRVVQQGSQASLALRGFNLEGAALAARTENPGSRFERVETPSGPSFNTARYEVSATPAAVDTEPNDTIEGATPIAVPGAASGVIAAGDVPDADLFGFEATAGQRLAIEINARRMGSPLDSVIEVLDSAGNPVPVAVLRPVAETEIVLRDHGSRQPNIRVDSFADFQINDYLMLGSEVIRLRAVPDQPDADITAWSLNGQRLTYFGTSSESHALGASVYRVQVHAPGSTFPPNGMPVFELAYRNDDGDPRYGVDSQLTFDVPADGTYYVRVSDVRGRVQGDTGLDGGGLSPSGEEPFYMLTIAPPTPDFSVSLSPQHPNVPVGGGTPLTVSVDRRGGFEGPVEVRLEGLPPGFYAQPAVIGADDTSAVIPLYAAADAPAPSGDTARALRAVATARIGEEEVTRSSSTGLGFHLVTLSSRPELIVQVDPGDTTTADVGSIPPSGLRAAEGQERSAVEIRRGQQITLTIHIERRLGFEGRVPVDVLNLPYGVRVFNVGLNGVLITEDRTSRTFTLVAEPWAEARTFPLYCAARVESQANEPHLSPPIWVTVLPEDTVALEGEE